MTLLFNDILIQQKIPHLLSAELKLAGATIVVCNVSLNSGSCEDVEAAGAAGAVKVEDISEVEAGGGVKGKVTDPFGFTWIFTSPAKKTDNCFWYL
ncbi:uncharacterized protein At5g48480-like [Eutrema salsugineum]|uniref:uncharacterized protein At5g48480-like n=1 Tax=Eutrema salsugineum TaxID=72664 RepID=UPI000CECEE3D|nr:uncharacterized protein At5g48480-like [Eutrema salsugineum]